MHTDINNNFYKKVNLLPDLLYAFFRNHHDISKLPLPRKIDDLILIRNLNKNSYKRYRMGEYRSSNGRKYIAKLYDKSTSKRNYYWLQNEITVYRELDKIYRNHRREIRRYFPHIRCPELYKVIENAESLILVTELIDGKPMKKAKPEITVKLYESIIRYFSYLSKFYVSANNHIVRRGSLKLTIIFLIACVKALIRYPRLFIPIIRSFIFFYANLPVLLRAKLGTLVHRDIHFENVLFDGKKIVPIDFEMCAITHPILEITHTAVRMWMHPELRSKFLDSESITKMINNTASLRLYKMLSVYTAVLEIAVGEDRNYNHSTSYLNYAHNLSRKNLS